MLGICERDPVGPRVSGSTHTLGKLRPGPTDGQETPGPESSQPAAPEPALRYLRQTSEHSSSVSRTVQKPALGKALPPFYPHPSISVSALLSLHCRVAFFDLQLVCEYFRRSCRASLSRPVRMGEGSNDCQVP